MDLYAEILASTIRMSVPLVLAALAGLWSERSGIVDIGLEGKMLAAAFIAASASAVYGSAWIGLFFAILVSVGLALVHGYASINQRGNQGSIVFTVARKRGWPVKEGMEETSVTAAQFRQEKIHGPLTALDQRLIMQCPAGPGKAGNDHAVPTG